MASRRSFLSLFTVGTAASLAPAAAESGVFRRRHRCATSRPQPGVDSHSSSKLRPEFIQPDYAKWRQVKEGMSRDELLALLGEPLYRQDTDPQLTPPTPAHRHYEVYSYYWEYGYLEFADPSMPTKSYDFTVHLRYATQKVRDKYDPFRGRFSADGSPTVPRLVVPHDKSVWNHFPRLLDLRWEPSSGMYPIRYEIELAHAQYDVVDGKAKLAYPYPETHNSDVPWSAISFGGKQSGRWRVRAENRLGRSDWSEYRYFEFQV